MSIFENIAKTIAEKFKAQGHEVQVTRLVEDWDLAEKYFDEFLKGSVLLGLSKIPNGSGNFLLFSKSQNLEETTASLELGGNWVWADSVISSLVIKDNEPLPPQAHSSLISQVNAHLEQKIVAFKLWKPLPHLALEFSDGSVLAIHGDNGPYESWGFYQSSPKAVGVYALPGGPIVVG